MQKVLITGCGIGNKMGVCGACNLDFSWLFNNVSTVLWADKICLPKDLFNKTINEARNKYDIAISIMLKELYNNNLIELLNDNQFKTSPDVIDALQKHMADDIVEMGKTFPETIKIKEIKDHDYLNILIQDQEYCIPYISSIYASLYMANEIGAHCLFNDHTYTFLKYKTGLDYKRMTHKSFIDSYNKVFSFILPNEMPPHYILTKEEACQACKKKETCESDYERNIKEYINKILMFRNYDELFSLRNEIDNIVSNIIVNGETLSPEAVKEELLVRQRKINKTIHKRFEQVKRWTNVATIAAIPATIISVTSGNNTAAIASATVGGAAKAVEKVMDIYKSHKSWIGFLQIK